MSAFLIVAAVAIAVALVAIWFAQAADAPPSPPPPPRVFSPEQLSTFTGRPKGTPIYLAIIGDVFDVTAGRKHYGPVGSYAHFAGRDATSAFATGESEPDKITESIEGLNEESLSAIAEWHGFYATHENYTRRGVVVGSYYDTAGNSLAVFPWARLERLQAREAEIKKALPDCNTKWSQATGSEVWCTTKSGGVEREWVGVPRLYTPSLDPTLDPRLDGDGGGGGRERCVCAPETLVLEETPPPALAHLQVYPGCDRAAERCVLPTT